MTSTARALRLRMASTVVAAIAISRAVDRLAGRGTLERVK
jgi:hypothetical protein